MEETTRNIEDVQIGQFIKCVSSYGFPFCGMIYNIMEYFNDDNKPEKAYRIVMSSNIYLDVRESDLKSMEVVDVLEPTIWLKENCDSYEVECFYKDGRRIDNQFLLAHILESKIWSRKSQKEQALFMEKLGLTGKDMASVINACQMLQEQRDDSHTRYMKLMDAVKEFYDEFNKEKETNPVYQIGESVNHLLRPFDKLVTELLKKATDRGLE